MDINYKNKYESIKILSKEENMKFITNIYYDFVYQDRNPQDYASFFNNNCYYYIDNNLFFNYG